MTARGKVIMICGKIGAGKTHHADALAARLGAVNLSQDELMITLFGAELYYKDPELHGSFVEKANEYTKKKAAELAAAAGLIVILDNGFWSKGERDEYRLFFASKGVECELRYVKTSEEQRAANVMKRNESVERGAAGYVLPAKGGIFDHFFEEPDAEEVDLIIDGVM